MRAGALIAVAALAAALAGCQSLSARECRAGDWDKIGRDDGAKGAKPSALERHREACAGHGVTPDAAKYQAGYEAGLATFCSPAGGYRTGRDGDGYTGVCDGAAEREFLDAYRDGQRVWHLRLELQELQRRADEYQMYAMRDDTAQHDRTNSRFRAEEWEQRATTKRWEIERLDGKYAKAYGVPELGWSDLRKPY